MLTTLRIKNLALVADLTLDFQRGFNAISGETGAGKSILIGALTLLLGERADRTLIRSGADSCTVEAIFEVARLAPRVNELLAENGLEACDENQLLLKRTFSATGANRQFVNGSPTTLAVLKALGELLVDIHGPHDHQSLLHAPKQLAILDAFGGLQELRASFGDLVRRRGEVEAKKSALIVDEKTYAQQLDLLRFQTNEISTAKLQPDEAAQLEQDFHRASNAARLLELSQAALAALGEDENALLTQAGAVGRSLQELQRLDTSAAPLLELHQQTTETLRELQSELSRYVDRIDLDPARLRELEERLNLIQSLKRKYGATVAEVIAFGEAAAEKLRQLEQRDDELARLNAELKQLDADLWKTGRELSAQRRKVIPKLSKAAAKQLADLGFKQSHFGVALQSVAMSDSRAAFSANGLDTVEFQFAPNPGEPARPLRAIASSGEMARVMLALKTVLAAQDEIPVLVFDEVDANIGGETAQAVGAKMRQLGEQRQVLCITHLAPVAAAADSHYVVSKSMKEGRTVSQIELVNGLQRVEELARMLGGQSEAARKHAQALLKSASDQ
ncbi:MAG: DNA repair protein RecN [Verrucomicrobia bacterium]|nr:DNA repair protein RecN [Verrucomicrobiota bacterium]